MQPQELSDAIRQKALELGFQTVGIIPAQPFQQGEGERLQAWLARGYQAEMGWMVTHLEKRLNPASLMDGTRSLVCVAMNYFVPDGLDQAAMRDPAVLKIARYARGTDYHYVLKDRLKELLAYVQVLVPTAQGRALTDSAPIMEKPLAVQAGIGWMGKHGNVILPGQGSWFFLGELLLDIELAYDLTEPGANHCGSCRRCIDACPTEAIVADGVVDANRCISYWTIEAKDDEVPAPIAEQLSGWVFGCDICQAVCPWNIKFSTPTQEPLFQPRPLTVAPDAQTLLALDEEAFRAQFRKNPIKRAKLKGLKRNVRAALGIPQQAPES
jgi:epoxyqueuosine reductase